MKKLLLYSMFCALPVYGMEKRTETPLTFEIALTNNVPLSSNSVYPVDDCIFTITRDYRAPVEGVHKRFSFSVKAKGDTAQDVLNRVVCHVYLSAEDSQIQTGYHSGLIKLPKTDRFLFKVIHAPNKPTDFSLLVAPVLNDGQNWPYTEIPSE